MNKFKILEIACEIVWGVNVKKKCREFVYVKGRYTFYKMALDLITKNVSEIARNFGSKHDRVLHSLKKSKFKEDKDVLDALYKINLLFHKIEKEISINKYREEDYKLAGEKIREDVKVEEDVILKLNEEIEKLHLENQKLKNQKLQDLPTWLVKILNYPKEVQEEFRDTRFKLFDKMIDSRKYSIRE